MTENQPDWEKEFDEKFVREDGLMNKYYFSDETKEEESAANVIKSFIAAEKVRSAEEEMSQGLSILAVTQDRINKK